MVVPLAGLADVGALRAPRDRVMINFDDFLNFDVTPCSRMPAQVCPNFLGCVEEDWRMGSTEYRSRHAAGVAGRLAQGIALCTGASTKAFLVDRFLFTMPRRHCDENGKRGNWGVFVFSQFRVLMRACRGGMEVARVSGPNILEPLSKLHEILDRKLLR